MFPVTSGNGFLIAKVLGKVCHLLLRLCRNLSVSLVFLVSGSCLRSFSCLRMQRWRFPLRSELLVWFCTQCDGQGLFFFLHKGRCRAWKSGAARPAGRPCSAPPVRRGLPLHWSAVDSTPPMRVTNGQALSQNRLSPGLCPVTSRSKQWQPSAQARGHWWPELACVL